MKKLAGARLFSAVLLALFSCLFLFSSHSTSAAETRTLKLHFIHTGEKASVTFKRNGKYDPNGLRQLSHLLRDWRRNEPTKMDPRLFDLLWEVYRQAGASDYIYAVSGYRSPETNAMLRSRSKGVAKESQHMEGTAVDFYIPGVSLKRLREIGMKMQAGGVGYYPNSRSPFVHMDVGGVRAWPRMSRSELTQLFPDGKTLHIPADGKPLPGYQLALADYKKRLSSNTIVMASNSKSSSKPKNLLAFLFGRGGDEDEVEDIALPDERPTLVAQNNAPAARQQQTLPGVAAAQPVVTASAPETVVVAANAPVPQSRPSLASTAGGSNLAVALYSPTRSAAEDALAQVATAVPSTDGAEEVFADLRGYEIPVPTLLGPRGMRGDAEPEIMTASVDPRMMAMDTGGMSDVPVPVDRPAVAEALLAAAEGMEEAELDAVEQAILSPEAAEALAMANAGAPAEAAAGIAVEPAAVPVPSAAHRSQPQTELAMLAPPVPTSRATVFGDGFDAPKPSEGGLEAGLPAKGGRPTEKEAETAKLAMFGGKPLTTQVLSSWALNKNQSASAASPTSKAPRVAGHSLTAAPAQVYSVGFKTTSAPIDPARFGAPSQFE